VTQPFNSGVRQKPTDAQKSQYRKVVGSNRRRLIERTAVAWLIIQLLVFCGRVWLLGVEAGGLISVGGLIITLSVIVASRRQVSTRVLSLVLLFSIALPIMALSYAYGGIHSPFLILLLFFPVATFMMVSRLMGWWATLFVCCFFVGLSALELMASTSLNTALTPFMEVIVRCVSFVLAIVCISGAGWYYSRMFDKMYLSIKKSNEELHRVAEYKTQFLANMSHEFRTPLNAIIGFSRRLQRNLKPVLSEKDAKGLAAVLRNGEMMQVLVNEVLEMANIETGDVELDIRETEVSAVIRTVLEAFTKDAREKKLDLTLVSPNDRTEVWCSTDGEKLGQILTNLISNAIKYTDEGSVIVTLDRTLEEELVIVITDSGSGIADEDLPRLFDQFSRARKVERSSILGAGLGLALTAELVKLLQAQIFVKSEVGVGSVFTVVLPSKLSLRAGAE